MKRGKEAGPNTFLCSIGLKKLASNVSATNVVPMGAEALMVLAFTVVVRKIMSTSFHVGSGRPPYTYVPASHSACVPRGMRIAISIVSLPYRMQPRLMMCAPAA